MIGIENKRERAMDSPAKDFELVEASINDLHAAVKTGSVTVTQVVESYIACEGLQRGFQYAGHG